jgi:hypothetical protein
MNTLNQTRAAGAGTILLGLALLSGATAQETRILVQADQVIRPVSRLLAGFIPGRPVAEATELSGPLDATNTREKPNRIIPSHHRWAHHLKKGAGTAIYEFAPHSFTIIHFE